MQKNNFLPWAMVSAVVLASCGGGGGGVANPVISSVSVTSDSKGQITVTANATAKTGVNGYCFKTSSTTPSPSDACFQSASSTTIGLPQTDATYVWAKDTNNTISDMATAGCSAVGLTASQASPLPTVCVSTSLGEFVLALESTKAPLTTANFLKYVNDGFYSQTVFHSVKADYQIQGGGYTGVPISSANLKTPTYTAIALEAAATTGLSNTKGTITMLRGIAPNSATSQFAINVVNNTFLDTFGGGTAVFGRVISGSDLAIENIRKVTVQNDANSEPTQPVTPPIVAWAYPLK